MNPFFFGPSARQLFGTYEPPVEGIASRGGIVLCPPLGVEYLLAYPAYRLLARQLSAAGYHVLRFDYYGTGDSAGEFDETDQSRWLGDIETAITELKDVAQVSRVGLIGLRYGATLAAMFAHPRFDVDQLVLWDVIVKGKEYLDEICPNAPADADVLDVAGVSMTARARLDIAAVNLAAFQTPLPRTLVIVTTPLGGSHVSLCAHLRAGGVQCALQHNTDVPAWREGRIGAEGLPVSTLRKIVAWLA